MNIGCWDKNCRPVFRLLHFVADFRLAQLIRDLSGILGFHIGKERNHVRFAAIPKTKTKNEDKKRERRSEHDVALPFVKAFPNGKTPLFPLSHNLFPSSHHGCAPASLSLGVSAIL